jgi:hypothetical protein
MTYPNLLIHLALLFLWCRIWTDDDRDFFFNPFISGPMRVVNRVLDVLRAPLPFLPDRVLAAIALLAALALKAAVSKPAGETNPFYHLHLVVEIIAFLIFAFQIAAINAILLLMSPRRYGRAGQVADLFARPVGWIRPAALQLLVVPVAIFLCCQLSNIAWFRVSIIRVELFMQYSLSKTMFISVILHFLNTLQVWSKCTLLAILASWAGLIMPRSLVAAYGRDFCSLLLGRFSGSLVVGMMDLTPLVFFFVVRWLHEQLAALIAQFL